MIIYCLSQTSIAEGIWDLGFRLHKNPTGSWAFPVPANDQMPLEVKEEPNADNYPNPHVADPLCNGRRHPSMNTMLTQIEVNHSLGPANNVKTKSYVTWRWVKPTKMCIWTCYEPPTLRSLKITYAPGRLKVTCSSSKEILAGLHELSAASEPRTSVLHFTQQSSSSRRNLYSEVLKSYLN